MHRMLVIAIVLPAGCTGVDDVDLGTTTQRSEVFPNARWVEGNGGPIDANGGPIDANGGPIDANSRRVDGVLSRGLGVNDLLPNPLPGKSESLVDAAAEQGWHLAETTDVFREDFPAAHRAALAAGASDRCLDLAGAREDVWRIAPSKRTSRVDGLYIESGFLEVQRNGVWETAPSDETLYLAATAVPVNDLLQAGLQGIDATALRPVVLRVRVVGPMPVRDPTDLGAETVGRVDGAMYRKQLLAVSFCLSDPADAPVAAWVPIGTVTVGDAYGYDVSPFAIDASRLDGVHDLAPWLRWKSYIGRDPGDTSAKAETYYTGGIVTRGDVALEPRLYCPRRLPRLPMAPLLVASGSDIGAENVRRAEVTPMPVAALNARIALVFANAIDAPLGSEPSATVLIGETVNGTPVRISVVPAAGCSLLLAGATTSSGVDTPGDWAPASVELAFAAQLDSLNGAVQRVGDGDVHRSRNTTACGVDRSRVAAWVETAPEDDGRVLPPRAQLARQRIARCDGVVFTLTGSGRRHLGTIDAWSGPGGLDDMIGMDYWVTAWAVGQPSRCGDHIYDREFEEETCPEDGPFAVRSIEVH